LRWLSGPPGSSASSQGSRKSKYRQPTGTEANVVLIARNTGSSIAVIDMIMANGAPCITNVAATVTIGDSFVTQFDACAGGAGGSIITGGVTNEIALHTTSGKTYPVAVLIP
jgi:hypothetical protein